MRSKYSHLVIIVVATYILYLGATNRLALYVHPRYIVFTMVFSCIGLVLALAASTQKTKKKAQAFKLLSTLPLFIMMGFALLQPARSLSSATAERRSTDAGSLVTTAQSKPLDTLFTGSSKGLGIEDWSRLLATKTDIQSYANKPAKFSGFVYDAGLGKDTVWLGRFVLTCCAVDAQPIGVPVRIVDWQARYTEDEWLEVEGEFSVEQTDKGEQIVLVPETVTQIERPDNPYAN